jgi:ferric-dicitrate binding protein FerR (iron transport regulator)
MVSTEGQESSDLQAAWEQVEAKWEDEAAHRHFVAFCAATGSLAEAGARYRAVAERDPARRERAKQQIGAVMATALLTLEAAREPAKVRSARLWWVLCGLVLVICGYGILTVLRRIAR